MQVLRPSWAPKRTCCRQGRHVGVLCQAAERPDRRVPRTAIQRSAPLNAEEGQSQVAHLVRALEALSVTLALGAHASAIAASQGRLSLPARLQGRRQAREQQQRQLVVSELAGSPVPVPSRQPLALGHQLWLTLPLLAAYLFQKLHSYLTRQDRRHDSRGGLDAAAAARLLRLESVAAEQQLSLAGMGRQMEKLRGRVRLVSQDLTLPLKDVQQSAAQQAELLAGLAVKLQQAERDIRDNQDLLVAMQGLSSKQFDLLLKVIKQQEEQARQQAQLVRDQRQAQQAAAAAATTSDGGTAAPAQAPPATAAAATRPKSTGGGDGALSGNGAHGNAPAGVPSGSSPRSSRTSSSSVAARVGGGGGKQPSQAGLKTSRGKGGSNNVSGGGCGGSGSSTVEVDEWGRRVVAPPSSSVSSKLIHAAAVSTLLPPAQQAEQPQQQGSEGAAGGALPPSPPAEAARGAGPEEQTGQQEKGQQQQQQQQQPRLGRPGGLSSTISKILDQDPYFKAEQQMYSALTQRLPGAPGPSGSSSADADDDTDSIQSSGDWWGGGGSGPSRGPPGSGSPGPTGAAGLAADAEGYSAPDPDIVERLSRLLQADGGAGSDPSEGGGDRGVAALFERGQGQRPQLPGLGRDGLAGGSAGGCLEDQATCPPNSHIISDSLPVGGAPTLPDSGAQGRTWQAQSTAPTTVLPARPGGAAAVHAAPCDGRMTARGGVGQVAWRSEPSSAPLTAGLSDNLVLVLKKAPGGAMASNLQQQPPQEQEQHGVGQQQLPQQQEQQQQQQMGHRLKLRSEQRAGRIVVHHPVGGSAIYEEMDDGSVVFSFSQGDEA